MTISYFIGQKYFPIKYELKNIFIYFVLAAVFYVAAMYPQIDNEALRLAYRTLFIIAYIVVIVREDLPLSEIPIISKYVKKK
jgi:hypothetical protein